MAKQSGKPSGIAKKNSVSNEDSFVAQIIGMASAFWASPQRNKLLVLAAAIIVTVAATAYGQIRLNAWNQPFYNALAQKDISAFIKQIGVFAFLAGLLLVLNVAQVWLNQITKVVLREGLVRDLTNEWLLPLRAFRLSNAGEIGANPDQRIHEDARHLTELTTDLGIGLLQATLLLLSFIGVLWVLSRDVVLSFGGHSFAVPGYMVWSALFYAGTASFLSWLVGRPLINLNAARYAREAELRFALVRVSEQIDGIALYGGETDEKGRLIAVFETVQAASRRLVWALTRLTWITAGYGWFTIAAPILVAAPIYFRGDMTLGQLMMMVGAFNQVQQALRWFVDNFSGIADWRATLLRVASFRRNILTMDKVGGTVTTITFVEADDQLFHIDELCISAPLGCITLSEPHVVLKPGERLLIAGEIGVGKTLLFQAVAGLWPWGSGHIAHPARVSIMFMTAHAYVPPGLLRAAITYPHSADIFEDAVIIRALARVGLERFKHLLDKVDRWDRLLNEDEKQSLAFARVILQKPRWVVLDDALDGLDPVSRRRIKTIFTRDLQDIGLISIGHPDAENTFFTRTLHILTDPHGPTFRPTGRHNHGHVDRSKPSQEALHV